MKTLESIIRYFNEIKIANAIMHRSDSWASQAISTLQELQADYDARGRRIDELKRLNLLLAYTPPPCPPRKLKVIYAYWSHEKGQYDWSAKTVPADTYFTRHEIDEAQFVQLAASAGTTNWEQVFLSSLFDGSVKQFVP